MPVTRSTLSADLTTVAFVVGLLSAGGIVFLLLLTLTTDRRLWPPGERSWPYYVHWSFVAVFNVSTLYVAYRDWNTWLLPRPASLLVGIALVGIGVAVFTRGAAAMDSAEVAGIDGELYTDGPYAYSRNPQYVGMLVGLVGFALVVNAVYVVALVAAHVGWVLLLPRAEERHLRSVFGDEYERYRARVPRFVGRHTVRQFLSTRSEDGAGR